MKRARIITPQAAEKFVDYKLNPNLPFHQRVEKYLDEKSDGIDPRQRQEVRIEIFSDQLFKLLKDGSFREFFLGMDENFRDEVMARALFKESRSENSSRSTFHVRDKLNELKALLEQEDKFFIKAVGKEIYIEIEETEGKVEIDKFKSKTKKKDLQVIIDSSIGYAFYMLEKNKDQSADQDIESLKKELLNGSDAILQVDGIALYYALLEEGVNGETTKKILQKIQSQFQNQKDCIGYAFATALYFIENNNHPNAATLQNFLLSQIKDDRERAVAVEYYEDWSGKSVNAADVQVLGSSEANAEDNSISAEYRKLNKLLAVDISSLPESAKKSLCQEIAKILSNMTLIEYKTQSRSLPREDLVSEEDIFSFKFKDRRTKARISGKRISDRILPFYSPLEKNEHHRITNRPSLLSEEEITKDILPSSSTRQKFPQNVDQLIRDLKGRIEEFQKEIDEEKKKTASKMDNDLIDNREALIKNLEEDLHEMRCAKELEDIKKGGKNPQAEMKFQKLQESIAFIDKFESELKEDRLLEPLFKKFETHKDLIEDIFINTFVELASVRANQDRYGILIKNFPQEFTEEKVNIIIANSLNRVRENFVANYQTMFDGIKAELGEKRMEHIAQIQDSKQTQAITSAKGNSLMSHVKSRTE